MANFDFFVLSCLTKSPVENNNKIFKKYYFQTTICTTTKIVNISSENNPIVTYFRDTDNFDIYLEVKISYVLFKNLYYYGRKFVLHW
jgi:hypothetical protein